MAIRTYKVTLDSKNTIAPEPVFLRQGDKTGAVVIDATLSDNGTAISLDGFTPMFKANTADGAAVIADSTGFTVVDTAGGEFTYKVPNALSAAPGKIKTAYFSFLDADGSESTFDVAFVIKAAVDMSQTQADDYITIIDGTLNSLREQIDAMNTDIQTVLSAYNQGDFYNKSETDSKDATTLASAKSYADSEDATTLASAKSYADSEDATTLASAKSYTDQYVYSDTGWQNLVMINGFVTHSTNTPQWRKVGNHVFLRGLLDTPIKAGKFANIPNAAPKQLSGFVCLQGSSNSTDMARVYANTDGSLEVIAMVTDAKTIQLNSIQYWTD
ncbi:BppU family phage baseplate upper protein [Lacticaseibacillus mingshuiensis]|uniref:BppU family phage baseplate upper protein n=1 Tax=Lacticaseibacillus mingshuiensis TaxID=2799574 RepID=A0ABW4CHV5_9LACO|nr:BppU family phage baseplate upper protein [Lacticaseibacillus mingshuiensis]